MKNPYWNKFVSSIVLTLAMMLMATSGASAQQATTTEQGVVVATVDITKAEIVGQEGNSLKIAFDIANKVGVQSQVRYDAFLVRTTKEGAEVLDKKVFDESLVIKENETIHRDVTYTAPEFLAGNYTLILEAFTSEGLPLASVSVGPVTLTGSGRYLEIVPNSCRLEVGGEASKKQYSAYRGIDIQSTESLTLACDIKSGFSKEVKAFPHISTYAGSEFGSSVNVSKKDELVVSGGKMGKMRIELPVQQAPRQYVAEVVLKDEAGVQASNKIAVYYTIHGATASAQNVVFDKASYKKGETANVTVTWLGSKGPFTEARLPQESLGEVQIETTLSGKDGKQCADTSVATQQEGWRFITVPITVTRDCDGVYATIVTKDQSGQVIGTSVFATEEIVEVAPEQKKDMRVLWATIGMLLIIALGLLVWKRWANAKTKATIIALLCAVGLGTATGSAQAMTQLNGVGSAGYIYVNQSAQDLANAMFNSARTAGSAYSQNIQQTQLTYCSYLGYATAASACRPPQTPTPPAPPRPPQTPTPVTTQSSGGIAVGNINRPPAGSVRCGSMTTSPYNANCPYGTAGAASCIGGHPVGGAIYATANSGQQAVPAVCVSSAGTWRCTNNYETISCPTYVAPSGSCGSANNQSYTSQPYVGLCSSGTASAVSGSGPWTWRCGSTSCQTRAGADGRCGTAGYGMSYSERPVNDLCSVGSPSLATLQPAGTTAGGQTYYEWRWLCYGVNGGNLAYCSAGNAVTVSGTCGGSRGGTFTSAPTTNLCSTGTASAVTGSGPWNWTCAGSGGGTTATCAANRTAPINGRCGGSDGGTYSSAPTAGLCAIGTASAVTGSGPWNWTCAGSGGGTTATCGAAKTVPAINGSCGAAHGQSYLAAPTAGLCAVGTASAVTGSGPWNWTCAGSGGGSSAPCNAQKGMRIIEVGPY